MTKWIELHGFRFKKKFVERYQKLLGNRFNEFIEWSLKPLRKSVRINTLKVNDINDIIKRLEEQGWMFRKVPWYNYGFWIEHVEERRDIGNTVEFQLGYIYSQEAASMIPPIVLDPKPDEIVLDLCAAPGSKTTQIAMHMNNEGTIVANDVEVERIKALTENIQRCGVLNTIVTMIDGRKYIKSSIKFDKILIDAPCSGVGALRKSYKTLRIWNPEMVSRLSRLQKQLIKVGFEILKPNGILVYSTCTLEPEENEGVVSWLLEKYDNVKIEKIRIKGLKRSDPVLEWEGKEYHPDIKYTLRIYPQDNDTEGFYVAKIKKLED